MARGGADKAPINHLGLPLPRWSLLQLPPASAEPCLPDPWTHISLEGVSVGKGLGPAHPRQTKACGEAVSAQGHPRVKCWLRPGLCPGGQGHPGMGWGSASCSATSALPFVPVSPRLK